MTLLFFYLRRLLLIRGPSLRLCLRRFVLKIYFERLLLFLRLAITAIIPANNAMIAATIPITTATPFNEKENKLSVKF